MWLSRQSIKKYRNKRQSAVLGAPALKGASEEDRTSLGRTEMLLESQRRKLVQLFSLQFKMVWAIMSIAWNPESLEGGLAS